MGAKRPKSLVTFIQTNKQTNRLTDIADVYGYKRMYTDVYGWIRIYTDVYGCIWMYTDIYGYIWIYTDVYGYIRMYMDVYGYIRMYMDVYGYIRMYTDVYVYMWYFMSEKIMTMNSEENKRFSNMSLSRKLTCFFLVSQSKKWTWYFELLFYKVQIKVIVP